MTLEFMHCQRNFLSGIGIEVKKIGKWKRDKKVQYDR